MRLLTLIIALLLVMIQYPLWLGKGGWLRTWELERQLDAQRHTNDELRTRNVALDAEVRDLKSGTDAIEERARYELGMLRQNEAFVQIVDAPPAGTVPAGTSGQPAARPAAAPNSR
ncbi:cell division protein FtsB [Pigmentiphaga sp.]|uniref:cell division protein FtsB n=1 Tax=Pigmentiphaga sp. TaxID=1977564 RepID=UPI00128BADFF|nr:cell division protein FtsB [Pigmentiphaga sp.]MPS28500.1 cell division protein FtsB [Alcaligenaceae bacterium SAGV5]MPS52165.1 cell division protein FtsB [Alcaligenaceae bacterium SAGV3]MPT56321.1 cell division protein FtsB [Alcaligenaceae bacterium]